MGLLFAIIGERKVVQEKISASEKKKQRLTFS
jgi:hypothetical protein